MRIRYLRELSREEKCVLSPYVFGDATSQPFAIQDGAVGGLVAKGILYRASNFGSYSAEFAFNIQPWAFTYLKAHTQLLSASSDSQRDQEQAGT